MEEAMVLCMIDLQEQCVFVMWWPIFRERNEKTRRCFFFFPVTRNEDRSCTASLRTHVQTLHTYDFSTEHCACEKSTYSTKARVCVSYSQPVQQNGDQINDERAKKSIATHHHWFSCLINNNNKTNFIPEV
jgi:hypothetical protein